MSTSPAENPVPGVVTFTARNNAAHDKLADALVAECDGSPAGIADLLETVLKADIEDLAETLSDAAQPAVDSPGPDIAAAGLAVDLHKHLNAARNATAHIISQGVDDGQESMPWDRP